MLYEYNVCFTISLLIMKKVLIALTMLLSIEASAQIQVYEKKDQTIYCTGLALHCISKVTVDTVATYWFSFHDSAYKHIEVTKSLRFNNKEDLMMFFVYIVSTINGEDSQILLFNDQTVNIKYENSVAKVYFEEGYFFMSKKQALRCIEEIKSFNN